ncbi:MAG: DUF1573 domain-containing protein [Planctomycetota bacterium]|nr:DUF1573 domain-containing protein [Planctomycetota bacterium]
MSGKLKHSLLRLFFVGVAALPFLLSNLFHVLGSTPRRPTAQTAAPALVFRQYMVDLGRHPVPPRPELYGHFEFQNVSDRTAEITELEPSCGCLTPNLPQRIFKPGEKGDFFIKIRTANETPGPKEYFVNIKYTDPEPRETTVTFRAVLPKAQVFVQPRALIFYQLSQKPMKRTITVLDARPEHLKIERVESDLDFLTIEVDQSSMDEESRRQYPIHVTVPALNDKAEYHGTIRILTNDKQNPLIRVPVIVQTTK